jgi:hypothetical protein
MLYYDILYYLPADVRQQVVNELTTASLFGSFRRDLSPRRDPEQRGPIVDLLVVDSALCGCDRQQRTKKKTSMYRLLCQ